MIILIAGATGLIGREIVKQCNAEGIHVNYLTTSERKIKNREGYTGFLWNPVKGEVDMRAFKNVTVIINLAGATISKRWTSSYKKIILDSRTQSANVLFKALTSTDHRVEHYVSASGVSVYPSSMSEKYSEKNTEVDTSFLADVVQTWEETADRFSTLDIRVTKLRTGVVLASDSGALPEMIKPIKMGLGSVLGSGEQWISWIHIEDIASIYLHIIEGQLTGVFNAVSPNPVTNRTITKAIALAFNKSLWLPAVPAFMLRVLLGGMSTLVLDGQFVETTKIITSGFNFKYPILDGALDNLIA